MYENLQLQIDKHTKLLNPRREPEPRVTKKNKKCLMED